MGVASHYYSSSLVGVVPVVGQYPADDGIVLGGECFLLRGVRAAEGGGDGGPAGLGFGPAGQGIVVDGGVCAGRGSGVVLHYGMSFC